MAAFAGMTNVRTDSYRHCGERRNPEDHNKTQHVILDKYRQTYFGDWFLTCRKGRNINLNSREFAGG